MSLAPENYQDRNHHWRDEILRIVPTQEKDIFPLNLHWTELSFFFFTSAVVTWVEIGEMSKLGWLIGWSTRDMWADSFYFLYVVFGWICKTFSSFQLKHVGLISIFQVTYLLGSAVTAMVPYNKIFCKLRYWSNSRRLKPP
jgi:hypothetical protein